MKKFLILFITTLFCLNTLLAQDNNQSEINIFTNDQVLQDYSNNKGFSLGMYQTSSWAFGEYKDYFSFKIGAGINIDYRIPLKNNYFFAPSFDFELGKLLPNKQMKELFSSSFYWTTKMGFCLNVPIFIVENHALYCNAKISYGLFTQNIITKSNELTMPKSSYMDQIFNLNTVWSYIPKKILDGKLQFNLMQETSFIPTKDTLIIFLGFALGLQYNF